MPARASPSMRRGSAEKTVPLVCHLGSFGAGFSKLAMAMSAPLISGAERTGVAGPLGVRQVPAERRAVLAATGDVGRPAVEREVGALALDLQGLVHAAVEHDVAAGEQRPGRLSGRRRCPQAQPADERSSGQAARSLTRSTPNNAASPQSSARTSGPTASARRNASRLPSFVRSAASAASPAARTSRRAVGRPGDAERREDGIGLVRDELDRVVAGARPGQHRLDLGQVRGGRCRPEVGDRHDRHVRDRGGRGWGARRRRGR